MAIFTDEQLQGIEEFIDEMLESFSTTCRLFYQPKYTEVSTNLQLADSTYMSNIGIHGGPILGISPETGDANVRASQATEDIAMIIEWELKDNKMYGQNMKSPYGIIRTHGFLSDLSKIQQCIEMQVKLPNSPITVARYRVFGEGEDVFSIVPNRYFICYWERIS